MKYLYSNLDRLVKDAIDTAGTDAFGTSVTVTGEGLKEDFDKLLQRN